MLGRHANEMEQIKNLRTELAQMPLRISELQNQIAVDEQVISERSFNIDAFSRDQIQPLQATVDGMKARIAQLTLPAEIQKLEGEIAACDTASSLLRSQIQALSLELAPIDAEISCLNSAIELKSAQQELDVLYRNLQEVHTRITGLKANYRSYELKFNEANNQYRNAELTLSNLRFQQNTDYAFNHSSWGHDHCGDGCHDGENIIHAFGDSILASNIYNQQQTVNRLRRQVNDYQTSMQSVVNAIRIAESDETGIQNQITQHANTITRNRVIVRGNDLNESIASLRDLKRIQEEKREPLENSRVSLQRQLNFSVSERNSHDSRIKAYTLELSRAELLARPYSGIHDASELKRQETQHQLQLSGLLGARAVMGGDITSSQVSIAHKRKAIDDCKTRAAELERWLLYPNAYDRFKYLLQAMPNDATSDMRKLYQYGWDLLGHIDEDEKRAAAKNKPHSFNKASHADVLNAAAGVLESHASLDSLSFLDTVMNRSEEDIRGCPSVTKKVFGGIMVFLGGALLIAGSSIIGCMLPYISWPLSYVGVAAGAGLLAGGITLIVSGRRKGADQSLHQFRELAPSAFRGSMFNPVVTTGQKQEQTMMMPQPTAPLLL